ncbi:flagellar hook-length control protein FliK [Halomonas denitrificans]|uniref:flagellar hook-length control protein FliK n=1 Tax=Halomonas denitrificans TaxID=370769 RepID=UPI000D3A6606|nr:flagellar hook-length control protein FliK [Halomonas denitrificans]
MDIQLLINAPGKAGGSRPGAGASPAPDDEFARHLAGASQAQGNGAGKADIPTSQASTGQAGASLTPPATQGRGETPADAATGDEALNALTLGATGPAGDAAGALALAPLVDAEIGAEVGVEAGRGSGTRLSAEEIEAALRSLEQGEPRPGTDDQNSGVWDALRKRLALIEQAGRPEADDALALLPLSAAGTPAGAQGPGTANPAAPAPGGAGQAVRINPLLEAIAAERRASATPSPSSATALSTAAERLTAQGSGQATAASEETLRLAAAGDALLAQRGETSRAAGGLELAGQGAANAVTGAMIGAAGGGTAGALAGSAATPAQASLPAPVASPAWSQQLGQQLVRLSQHGGEQRVELKLHPAELGPLSVSLKMSDHGAQAQFISAHAQVRQALEQAIPQLREALAEQGISLGETSVGEQRQGGSEGDGAPGRPGERQASPGSDAAEEGTTVALEERGVRERALDGRVDLYA